MSVPTSADGPLFFDRSGEPIDLARYAELHSDLGYRILARDSVGREQPFEVVTAWLGMDQAFGDDSTPMIFGTVALDAEGQLWQDQERLAATEAQALLNHRALVTELS